MDMEIPVQPAYRTYRNNPSSASQQRSAHVSGGAAGAGGGRRAPSMMPTSHPQAPPAPTAAQIQAQQAAAMAQLQEAAKRRSRKPTDKTLPDGIEDMIGGDLGPPLVGLYKRMQDFERRMDATMMRKRLDFQETIKRNEKVRRTLRVWITNTVENQPWQVQGLDDNTFDFNSGAVATYRVTITGRLLDEEEEEEDRLKRELLEHTGGDGDDDHDNDDDSDNPEKHEGESTERQPADESKADDDVMDVDPTEPAATDAATGSTEKPSATSKEDDGRPKPAGKDAHLKKEKDFLPDRKFSHYLKAVHVEIHRDRNNTPKIEWKKPHLPTNAAGVPVGGPLPPAADFNHLHFRRNGDENLPVTIYLHLDETPERFKLSDALANVLDLTDGTRTEVVQALYEYIKLFRLQEEEEKRTIRCDKALRTVFQRERIYLPHLPELVVPHLLPLPPVALPYTIRVDKAFHTSSEQANKHTVYDISMTGDSPARACLLHFLQTHPSPTALRRIGQLDDQVGLLVQAMQQSKARHDFHTAYAKDPVGFLHRWTDSQRRDLAVILGESTRAGGATSAASAAAGAPAGGGGFPDEDLWRRGGPDGVWASEEVREAIALMLATQGGVTSGLGTSSSSSAATASAAAAAAMAGGAGAPNVAASSTAVSGVPPSSSAAAGGAGGGAGGTGR